MHPLRFYSLWAINGPLDAARLRFQLEEFKRLGLDGVVFHPRFYPGIPAYMSAEYLALLDETILHAKSLGMAFWIYDENGWPSGTADGGLYRDHPEDTCQRLDLLPEPSDTVLGTVEQEGRIWHLCVQAVRGIDCYNPDATRHFLEAIHERYLTGLSAEAFAHIEAFYTDEPESGVSWEPLPQYAAVPWSRRMPEFLHTHFGRDVTAQLPLLFAEGEGAAEFRCAYWELVTDLFCQGFLDPYRAWCEKNGKLFVGHIKGEEHPLFQLPMVGSCQQVHHRFSLPGIDSLERPIGNHFYPRQASSVARQFGTGRCMVEANGGSGWGNSPEDLERYLLWLGRQGLTDFVLHLGQYRLDSAALHDWPPSQPLHISWSEAYPEVLHSVRKKIAAEAEAPRDTLVVVPYRRIMETYEPWELWKTNIHDGDDYPPTPAGQINTRFLEQIETLHASGIGYDVVDERTFEAEAVAMDGTLRIGNSRYTTLLASDDVKFSSEGGELLNQVQRQHVRIVPQIALRPPQCKSASAEERLIPLAWTSVIAPENAFLLEPAIDGKGHFLIDFATPSLLSDESDLAFFFADTAVDIEMNGHRLTVIAETDGFRAPIPAATLLQENKVTFKSNVQGLRPFVWLKGHFLALSRTPYTTGPNGTIRTQGPFTFLPSAPLSGKAEGVASGLPGAFQPLRATTEVHLPIDVERLRFAFPEAAPDALHITIDGIPLGTVWGPEWTLSHSVKKGTRRIEVLCIPSSYNHYGPHHYYLGDGPIISPDQVRGIHNFADPVDAPTHTAIPEWHFKPWRLPLSVNF